MNLTCNYNGGQVESDTMDKYGSLSVAQCSVNSNLAFSPTAFKGLVDISGPFLFTIHARAQRSEALMRVSTTAALEAAPAGAAAAAGEAGRAAPQETECEAVPQPAAAAAEVAAGAGRFANSNAAAAVSGEGCCCGRAHAVGLLSGLEGLPNLLESDFRCDGLHFTDETGEVADEVRVQLQVAVNSAFDPEWIIRLPCQFPQLLTM